MILIFYFSQQCADDSKQLSVRVADGVFGVLKSKIFGENYITPIRKLAHFSIYFLLGACVMYALFGYKLKMSIRWVLCVGICFLYASSDEIHQMFVPGRGPMISDVLLDSVGAAFGAAVLFGIYFILKKRKKN